MKSQYDQGFKYEDNNKIAAMFVGFSMTTIKIDFRQGRQRKHFAISYLVSTPRRSWQTVAFHDPTNFTIKYWGLHCTLTISII